MNPPVIDLSRLSGKDAWEIFCLRIRHDLSMAGRAWSTGQVPVVFVRPLDSGLILPPYLERAAMVLEWAAECGFACRCGGEWASADVDDSGVQPGTHDGPAVHWWSGWLECECGRRLSVADSS